MNATLTRIPLGMLLIAAVHVLAALGYLTAVILGFAGVFQMPADLASKLLGVTGPLLWLLCAACIFKQPSWGFSYCIALFSFELGLALAGAERSSLSIWSIGELAIPVLCGVYICLRRDYFESRQSE